MVTEIEIIAIIVVLIFAGIFFGWLFRGRRKRTHNPGNPEELPMQVKEHTWFKGIVDILGDGYVGIKFTERDGVRLNNNTIIEYRGDSEFPKYWKLNQPVDVLFERQDLPKKTPQDLKKEEIDDTFARLNKEVQKSRNKLHLKKIRGELEEVDKQVGKAKKEVKDQQKIIEEVKETI